LSTLDNNQDVSVIKRLHVRHLQPFLQQPWKPARQREEEGEGARESERGRKGKK